MHNLDEGNICMKVSSTEFNSRVASTKKKLNVLRKTFKGKLFKKQTEIVKTNISYYLFNCRLTKCMYACTVVLFGIYKHLQTSV